MSFHILLSHAAQLLTLRGGNTARRGAELCDLGVIQDGAVLVGGGKIIAVGTTDQLRLHEAGQDVEEIDCSHCVVLPGFVDSHTHPVFAAPRLLDFERRIAGDSYEEIAAAGGGIRSSMRALREATTTELSQWVLQALEEMRVHGTTTVEAKSGYGLEFESELKSLQAIRCAAEKWSGTVVPTFLGAHVVPPEYRDNPDGYVRVVCEEMVPAIANGFGTPHPRGHRHAVPEAAPNKSSRLAEYVDVYCDRGAFTPEQSVRILRTAAEHGLKTRAHVCQLTPTSLEVFTKLKPASLDHLDHISEDDIGLLARTDTIATLLPAANYFLGLSTFPPARKLIEAGVAVALATDYNPGTAPTTSMPFVLSVACTHMKMSPAEAITASTFNGACALQWQHRKGSLEPGKDADIAIFAADDYRELAYWFGVNRCRQTILGGPEQLNCRPE